MRLFGRNASNFKLKARYVFPISSEMRSFRSVSISRSQSTYESWALFFLTLASLGLQFRVFQWMYNHIVITCYNHSYWKYHIYLWFTYSIVTGLYPNLWSFKSHGQAWQIPSYPHFFQQGIASHGSAAPMALWRRKSFATSLMTRRRPCLSVVFVEIPGWLV